MGAHERRAPAEAGALLALRPGKRVDARCDGPRSKEKAWYDYSSLSPPVEDMAAAELSWPTTSRQLHSVKRG